MIFIGATIAIKIFIQSSIRENEAQVDQLKNQLSSSNNQALEKEVASLNTQIRNIKAINQQHFYWSKALAELGNLTPIGCHLDSVTFSRSTGEVKVDGIADTRTEVIDFWSNVKNSDYFNNINFPLTNLETATNTSFSYTFHINPEKIKQP